MYRLLRTIAPQTIEFESLRYFDPTRDSGLFKQSPFLQARRREDNLGGLKSGVECIRVAGTGDFERKQDCFARNNYYRLCEQCFLLLYR
jgi:hypothetical protein